MLLESRLFLLLSVQLGSLPATCPADLRAWAKCGERAKKGGNEGVRDKLLTFFLPVDW